MTVEQFSRQTYLYPALWFLFATIVAFIAAILFWQKGSSSAEGKVPALAVTWKFTGAGAVFVVVLLVFWIINPIKSFSDYKSILLILSNEQQQLPSPANATQFKIEKSKIKDDKDIPFNETTVVQMTPVDSTYNLLPELAGNSFGTNKAIPKGFYIVWFISSATGKVKYYQIELK